MLVSCTKCKKRSPGNSQFFGPDKRSPSGRQAQCRRCRNAYKINDYYQNREKYLLDRAVYRAVHRDKLVNYFRALNKDPNRVSYLKKHRKEKKQHYYKSHRRWRLKNLGLRASDSAKRRATELKASPKWLTEEQVIEIKSFYIDASELSWLSADGLAVDHIIPLNSKIVCGLHVPWNLRIIPSAENLSKGNKLIEGLNATM